MMSERPCTSANFRRGAVTVWLMPFTGALEGGKIALVASAFWSFVGFLGLWIEMLARGDTGSHLAVLHRRATVTLFVHVIHAGPVEDR